MQKTKFSIVYMTGDGRLVSLNLIYSENNFFLKVLKLSIELSIDRMLALNTYSNVLSRSTKIVLSTSCLIRPSYPKSDTIFEVFFLQKM